MNDLLCNEELRDAILSAETNLKNGISPLFETTEDKVKFICKFAPIIIAALNIAKLFVGRREKEIINAFIDFLKTECSI